MRLPAKKPELPLTPRRGEFSNGFFSCRFLQLSVSSQSRLGENGDMNVARRFSPLMLILAVALSLRLAAALGMHFYLEGQPGRDFLIAGDAVGYWKLAETIAGEQTYAVHDPPRRIMRMPGFPALLALAGRHVLRARLLLAVVGTLACWLVYCLGRELIDERTGLIAATLTAMSPAMVVFSVLILSETAFAAAMLLSLLMMARLLTKSQWPKSSVQAPMTDTSWNRRFGNWSLVLGHFDRLRLPPFARSVCTAFLVGVTVALACYVRPGWLLMGPVFAVAYAAKLQSLRRGVLAATAVAFGMGVTLLPWVVRNYTVTGGRIVITTLWVGPSLYDGLKPAATGASDMTFFDRDDVLGEMSEYEMDRYYRRKAWEFAREHPRRVVELAGLKLIRYWKPWPNAAQFRHWPLVAVSALFFIVIFVPGVLGVWVHRRQPGVLLLALGPILYFAAVHSIFVGSVRYRLPAEYPFCILTAAGIVAWWRNRQMSS